MGNSLFDRGAAAVRRFQRRGAGSGIESEIEKQMAAGEISKPDEYLDRWIFEHCGGAVRQEGEENRHFIARVVGLSEAQLQEYFNRVTAGESPAAVKAAILAGGK